MIYDSYAIAKTIKKLRCQKGMRQIDLADRAYVSERQVRNWEKGEYLGNLSTMDVVAKAFDMSIDSFFQEIDKETIEKPLKTFDEKANDSYYVIGYKNVNALIAAFKQEYEHNIMYDNLVDNKRKPGTLTWDDKNTVTVIIEKNTKEVYALRDFGKHLITPGDYFLNSEFIPMYVNPCGMVKKEDVETVLAIYDEELKAAKELGKKSKKTPIFLTEHIGRNNYRGTVLKTKGQNRQVGVLEYKQYRDYFYILDPFDSENAKDIKKADDYVVYTPSEKLIDLLMLNLYPSIWQRRMLYDKFEQQNLKQVDAEVAHALNSDRKVYSEAIDCINNGRARDLRNFKQYHHLENMVEHLENLVRLGVPSMIYLMELRKIKMITCDIYANI